MRERRSARLPWIIFGASLLSTIAAAAFIGRLSRTVTEVRFANAIQSATDRITGRLDIYNAILRGGAALFGASTDVTRSDFQRFAERLEVQRRLPGIQGIGWSERLRYMPGRVPDETHTIRYLEPLDERNRAALGFDMYSDSARRAAMARARDNGSAAISGRVTLLQEIHGPQQPGFLLYVPVYAGADLVPQSVDERRRLLRGFVYAPFRAHDLFAGIFGTEREPRVSFSVFDGPVADTARLLFRSRPTLREHALTQLVHLTIADRLWTVEFRSEPALEQGVATNVFWPVLLCGLLLSATIAWLSFAQSRARAAAEDANRAKSDFLAVMSHELRTPLNAIAGYVDLLELGIHGPLNAEQLNALARVRRAKDHLLSLINDLLNYARLEAGRVQFRRERVNVESLLDTVSEMIAPQAEANRLIFTRVPGNRTVEMTADREKAQQILLNLLSNALKFTNPGGTIILDWTQSDDDVCIAVRDTGIGIPRDRLATIFDPFVQVDAPLTRDHAGSGLGLAISRDLSRAMDGDISVASEPGVGSTFMVRLPRAPNPASPSGGMSAAPHETHTPGQAVEVTSNQDAR